MSKPKPVVTVSCIICNRRQATAKAERDILMKVFEGLATICEWKDRPSRVEAEVLHQARNVVMDLALRREEILREDHTV